MKNFTNWFNKTSLLWAKKYPKAWSYGWLTQLVVLGFVLIAVLLVGMILPNNRMNTASVGLWFGLGFIPAFFWWLFIIYRLVKFNSDKDYGNRKTVFNHTEFLSYFGQLLLPLVIPFFLSIIINTRVASLVSDADWDDYNETFQEAETYMTLRLGNFNAGYHGKNNFKIAKHNDGCLSCFSFFPNDATYQRYIDAVKEGEQIEVNKRKVDKAEWIKNEFSEETEHIFNHEFQFSVKRPKLYPIQFSEINAFRYYYHNSYRKDTLKMEAFIKNYKNIDVIKASFEKYLDRLNKYTYEEHQLPSVDLLVEDYQNNNYSPHYSNHKKEIAKLDYLTDEYRKNLGYIKASKNYTNLGWLDDEVGLIIMYIIGCAAILLSIFKQVTWQEFLIAALIAFSVTIITGIIVAVSGLRDMGMGIIYWLEFFLVLHFFRKDNAKGIRSKLGAFYALTLTVVLLFLPIAIWGSFEEIFHLWSWDFWDAYKIPAPTQYNADNWEYTPFVHFLRYDLDEWIMWLQFPLYVFVWFPLVLKPIWLKHLSKPMAS